jgi:hypothetical protein
MSGRADALQSLADKVSAEYALDRSLVLNKWSMINGKTNGLGAQILGHMMEVLMMF